MRLLIFSALVALTTFSALNWRSQAQSQQKLDALVAALAERPAAHSEPAAPPISVAPPVPVQAAIPRQLNAKLPTYVIEVPDVLLIQVVKKDVKTGTFNRLPEQPISGQFHVRLDGSVDLGFWGQAEVSGLTLDQASTAIRDRVLKSRQAELTAENLVVHVEVHAANSKKYYVITDVSGTGEAVFPFPCTGSATVLDALANVRGLSDVASKKIWVARRTQEPGQPWQTLSVDWAAITQRGTTETNYQLLPGDRLYVSRKAQ